MSSGRAEGLTRVVVLGAGFAGLELITRLSEEFGDDIEIVLIDQNDSFVFGFSKLDVMFGRAVPERVRHAYARHRQAGRPIRPDGDPVDRPGRPDASRPTRARSRPTCWSSRSEPTSIRPRRPG